MSSSSGQGFTGSIVNGISNYVLADRSTIGMGDGVTGAIQYVKLVWGGSGDANLVTDSAVDPSALPVSLNTPENFFLTDALINGMTYTNGVTAFAVKILDAAGLCLGSVSINLGAGFTLEGVKSGLVLGVTFGNVSAPSAGIAIKNASIGGVTQALGVTGSVYILGGTVAVSGLSIGSLSFGGGVTINGISAGLTLPVSFGGGTLDGIVGTVGTRIKGIDSGVTLAAVLYSPGGTFLGSGFCGSLLISGVSGATPVGVTFGGITGSVNVVSLPNVKIDSSNNTVGLSSSANTVKIDTSNNTVGLSSSANTVKIDTSNNTVGLSSSANTVKIDTSNNTVKITPSAGNSGIGGLSGGGTTFNSVLTTVTGVPIGYSGTTFIGFPVYGVSGATALYVQIVGGLSGITVSGITVSIPSAFTISGFTYGNGKGVTSGLPVFGVSGATAVGVTMGTVGVTMGTVAVDISNSNLDVTVKNDSDSTAVRVKYVSGWSDSSGTSLKTHLDGLSVSASGLNFSGGVTLTGVGIAPSGISANGTGITGIGVTFGIVKLDSTSQVSLSATSSIAVDGSSNSRTTAPVGVTHTGALKELKAFGISGSCATTAGTALAVALYAYAGSSGYSPLGMSGDALKVSIQGGLSGITITGFSFPTTFGVSGGTIDSINIRGGTFQVLNIGNISGGTLNIGNTVAVTGTLGVNIGNTRVPVFFADSTGTAISSVNAIPVIGLAGATALRIVFSDAAGTPLGVSGPSGDVVGVPVIGVSGATAIGVTFASVGIRPAVGNSGVGGLSGGGTTFNSVLTTVTGVPIGYSGTSFLGFPVYGVSGATAIPVQIVAGTFGVTLNATVNNTVTLGSTLSVFLRGMTEGGTLNVVLTTIGGTAIGYSGTSFFGFPVFGVSGTTAIGVTFASVGIRPAVGNTGTGGISGGGTTFNVLLTDVRGVPIGHGISGNTVSFLGFPVYGVSGATAIPVDLAATGAAKKFFDGISYDPDNKTYIGVWNSVTVTGTSTSTIGVTWGSGAVNLVAQEVTGGSAWVRVKTDIYPLSVTGSVALQGVTNGATNGISRTGVLFTNNHGVALGLSGATVVGLPVFGVQGATAIGVTFGAITFGSGGMGVTFGGITFGQTRTIITSSAFTGGQHGIPVFGLLGMTAVQVSVVGGTISGIFTTEPGGITVTGLSSGLPIVGVAGATAVGVTFTGNLGITGTVNIGNTHGVTFGGITGSVNIVGTPSVSINGTPTVAISGDVNVKPATGFESTKVIAGTADRGFIVTQKAGPKFARGLTLDANFISVVLIGGVTAFQMNSSPVCITKNYSGETDGVVSGEISVPLKQGLYVQLTKWDLISHVYIGYTAGTTFEFDRNAQVLHREYQVAPIWGNAMEQFRRYAGASGNSSTFELDIRDGGAGTPSTVDVVQKQFVGVIEKPSRIFIPCRNAGEVYIRVVGDYSNHAIGSGFWNWENASLAGGSGPDWTDYTLYERGYFASDYSGIAHALGNGDGGLGPDLDVNGNVVDSTTGVATATAVRNSVAIQKILQSYQNNPFIRIWGY